MKEKKIIHSIPKLAVVYASSDLYAMPTMISLLSLLENNNNASELRVQLSVHVYTEKWSKESLENLQEIAKNYNVEIKTYNPQEIVGKLKNIGIKSYRGSYMMDLKLIAPLYIEDDCNLLFLDSDIIMNTGSNLYELAVFDFENGKKSCASVIDMQSSKMVKKAIDFEYSQHIFNTSVFLVNPSLYKKHRVIEQILSAIKEKGMLLPYKDVLRNAYAYRNEMCVLPMKYEVYPGQKILKIDEWMYMFGLSYDEYYDEGEIESALNNPCFIHYIDFIVSKPWLDDTVEDWPYLDVWIHFQDKTKYRGIKWKWEKNRLEKIKRYIFINFKKLWIILCAICYRVEVKRRNRIISKAYLKRGKK